MKTITLVLLLFVGILGCGKKGSDPAPSKDLFSVWTLEGDTATLDMTGGSFGLAMPMSFLFAGGEICDVDFSLVGTQASGNYVLSNSTYRVGSGGGADPGCAALDQNGTYSNSAARLAVCETAQPCEYYR